ncbi:hypothetical protein [Runella rosea]|uniref:hypothetical protein n=1 Tax=Runella rosea TaxID=2259595 RepID=UPI0013B3D763|nr:hypothetical protein [Runella rosea]
MRLCAQSTSGTAADSIRAEYQRNAGRVLEDLRRADFLSERLEVQRLQVAATLQDLKAETARRQTCESKLGITTAALQSEHSAHAQTKNKLALRTLEAWAWRIGAVAAVILAVRR